MSSDVDLQQKLLARITSRRASIRAYLKGLERRSSWLLNTSIVSTAAAKAARPVRRQRGHRKLVPKTMARNAASTARRAIGKNSSP